MNNNDLTAGYHERILQWGENNTRNYPWRQVVEPYKILLAEFTLHRTQAKQAEHVYSNLVSRFPTLKDFAVATDEELLQLLTPLGLYWRIKLMIQALKTIYVSYTEIPLSFDILKSVPGVGPYIAGATVCFSQNRPVALVDTNTVRVIGRIYGLDLQGEARRKKQVIEKIADVCHPTQPRKYYYALIDLAHTICKIKEPFCNKCPFYTLPCVFAQNQERL